MTTGYACLDKSVAENQNITSIREKHKLITSAIAIEDNAKKKEHKWKKPEYFFDMVEEGYTPPLPWSFTFQIRGIIPADQNRKDKFYNRKKGAQFYELDDPDVLPYQEFKVDSIQITAEKTELYNNDLFFRSSEWNGDDPKPRRLAEVKVRKISFGYYNQKTVPCLEYNKLIKHAKDNRYKLTLTVPDQLRVGVYTNQMGMIVLGNFTLESADADKKKEWVVEWKRLKKEKENKG